MTSALAPMMVVRVQTDWVRAETEFRYVLQAVRASLSTACRSAVIFVPREVTMRACAEELKALDESQWSSIAERAPSETPWVSIQPALSGESRAHESDALRAKNGDVPLGSLRLTRPGTGALTWVPERVDVFITLTCSLAVGMACHRGLRCTGAECLEHRAAGKRSRLI
jgi:hypothetical protein